MKSFSKSFLPLFVLLFAISCNKAAEYETESKEQEPVLAFAKRTIADSVKFLWAHDPIDLTNDGIVDLLFIDSNDSGGKLGYYEGQSEEGTWKKVIIDIKNSDAGNFAMGDIEGSDIDNDGDIDIVVARHTGEWEASTDPSQLYWYENPGWTAHYIGEVPDFIKDVSITDFNKDGQKEVAALTFESGSLTIFEKSADESWNQVQQYMNYKNLHEGMDAGDIDGDGYNDIVAEGHIFYSPGKDLTQTWQTDNIDEKWNTQEGDWSRNGTKVFVHDLDGDNKSEIFISHSERSGYPLSYYSLKNGSWNETIIADSIAACHTLQVYDFNNDGRVDILAGVNRSRGQGLGQTNFPVILFLSDDSYTSWNRLIMDEDGIYNGQAADFDGDGDMDVFRYQTHDATTYQLFENTIIQNNE